MPSEASAAFRTVPIFDARAQPQSWSERMSETEYAVMLADARNGAPLAVNGEPVADVNRAPCLVFTDLASARAWSEARIAAMPTTRCRIYDHEGLAKQPTAEYLAPQYKRKDPLNRARMRKVGIAILIAAVALCLAEWISGFRLSWAGMIGARLLPVAFILLVTELAFYAEDVRKRRRAARGETSQ